MKPITSTLLIILLLVFSAPSLAQQDSAVAQDAAPQAKRRTEPDRVEISIDFPGGYLSEYINLLRNLSDANIVVASGSVNSYQVPSVQLKKVPLMSAVNVLERISNGQIKVYNDRSIMFISMPQRPKPETSLHVLSVKSLIKDKGQEELLSAIEIGLQLLGASEGKVEIKLHTETGLLFVKGSDQQLRVVDQIVSEMMVEFRSAMNTQRRQMEQRATGSRGGSAGGGTGEAETGGSGGQNRSKEKESRGGGRSTADHGDGDRPR